MNKAIVFAALIYAFPAHGQTMVSRTTGAEFLRATDSYKLGYTSAAFDFYFAEGSRFSRADIDHFSRCIAGNQAPRIDQINTVVVSHINANPKYLRAPAMTAILSAVLAICGAPKKN